MNEQQLLTGNSYGSESGRFMEYEGITYRPPPEADTPLLQVTVGCAYNRCAFCNMYRDVTFRTIEMDRIENDIKEIKYIYPRVERIFLVNGDAFVLSADKLTGIAKAIHRILPECETISMYASVRNIGTKSDSDLERLKANGIDDLYIGLESGWDDVLTKINKGHSVHESREQLHRLDKIGIHYSINIMLGLAGHGRGTKNAEYSASLVNTLSPTSVWVGTTEIFRGTELNQQVQEGQFSPATELEILEEQLILIDRLDLENVLYLGNHPSNLIPVSGTLSKDKERMIDKIKSGIAHYGTEWLSRPVQRQNL